MTQEPLVGSESASGVGNPDAAALLTEPVPVEEAPGWPAPLTDSGPVLGS